MTTDAASPAQELVFVTGVSEVDVLGRFLCQSPCIRDGRRRLVAHFNTSSAAEAFNAAIDSIAGERQTTWLVWVHQDVLLPGDWDTRFLQALREAQQVMPRLAVAGVYGIAADSGAGRAGHVLDRGVLLHEPAALPCTVGSLDELLVAVRADTGLKLDPALGFDLYATDLVLQAQESGWQAAAVDAYCEHWSGTPSSSVSDQVAERVIRSGRVFEAKWSHRFPIETSWVAMRSRGDIERFVNGVRARP